MGTGRVMGQLLATGLLLWLLLPLREVLLCLVSRLVVAGWYVALVPALPLTMTRHIAHLELLFYLLSCRWAYDTQSHLGYFRVTI